MATLEKRSDGPLEVVVLCDGELRAAFVPRAGMIGCSLRHRGAELLVQRGGLSAWRGTGRSFGLPLLHPWANRLPDWRYAAAGRAVGLDRSRGIVRADASGLPVHGALAAAEDWELVAADADADSAWLSATLEYGRRDDRLAVFPFPHTLGLEARLRGDTLTVTTTVTATGDIDVPLAFGWHPWLTAPGAARADWELELPAREQYELDARLLPTGARTTRPAERFALGRRVLDEHHAVAEDACVALVGGGRRLELSWAGGYRFAQIFAPGSLDVVCIEPMMAPVAALSTGDELRVAGPGETARASWCLRVTEPALG